MPLGSFLVWMWPGEGIPPVLLSLRGLLSGLLAAAPPLLFLAWMLSPAGSGLAFTRRIERILRDIAGATIAALGLPEAALIALAAGIGEEVLFRGVLQPRLGLPLTALLFGLLHPFSPAYVVIVVSFGLYLGWLLAGTGDLLVPIAAHALYDFVALLALRRRMKTRRCP